MCPSRRITSWEDWTRVYNDVSFWRGLIDAICAREGISYRELHSASANTNAVFLLDRAYALKIYSPFWDEYDFERALLEALGPRHEIPTPELVDCGHISNVEGVDWPYLITRYCAARPFSEIREALSDREAASLAQELGRIVRALHWLDPGLFADVVPERKWTDLVAERRRGTLDELTGAGVLKPDLVYPLERLLDEAVAADAPDDRVVVHGDLGPDHVLCAPTPDGWTIEALIDFGDAKIGVREYEWMPLWLGFCARDSKLARAFLDAYDPSLAEDPAFPNRAIAWTLLHDFGTDELIRQWHEQGQAAPIESIEELRELLCPESIFRLL